MRLLGSLIAYYEADVQFRDMAITQVINALPQGGNNQKVNEIERMIITDRIERQNRQGGNESIPDKPLSEQ